MRSTIVAGVDSLDERGVFNAAPITEESFREDFFGHHPLIEQTTSRIKEILESKPGNALHNEMHLVNAMILCFGLAAYHFHHGDVSIAHKMLKEAESLTEKHLKPPFLFGIIYLHAAQGLRCVLSLDQHAGVEYQNYIQKAFTYFNAVSSDEMPALLKQLMLAKDLKIHWKHRVMLEDFLKINVEKLDNVKSAYLLLNYYINPYKNFNFNKIKNLLQNVPAEEKTHALIDMLEQRVDGYFEGENESLWFYQCAVQLTEKIAKNDIARFTRLAFKKYTRTIGTSEEKSYQAELEQWIMKLSQLPLDQRNQFSSCFHKVDWDKNFRNWYPYNLSEVGVALSFALRILELFPQKIGDLIEIILEHASRYGNFAQLNSKVLDNSRTEWINYLNNALNKTQAFLFSVKQDRASMTYFTDDALNKTLFQIFTAFSKSIGDVHCGTLEWGDAACEIERSHREQVQKFLVTVSQFVLKESEPYAHVFPNYLTFRTHLRLKISGRHWFDKTIANEMREHVKNEIFSSVEKHKTSASLITLMRPVVAELLAPAACSYYHGAKYWTHELAVKAYELASIIKDNLSILKSQIVLASFYTSEDFRYDNQTRGTMSKDFKPEIGQAAKKFLLEFLTNAKQASPDDLRDALCSVQKNISKYYVCFSLNESNLLLAAMAANCEKDFMRLMNKLTAEHCLRGQWMQLLMSCSLVRYHEYSASLHAIQQDVIILSGRIADHHRYNLIHYFKDTIERGYSDDKIKHVFAESLTHIDPVLGWLSLSEQSKNNEIINKRLYHAAMGLLSDYRKKSTRTLLFQCDALLESPIYSPLHRSVRSLDVDLMNILVTLDKALVIALQELLIRSKTFMDHNSNNRYFIEETGSKKIIKKLVSCISRLLLEEEKSVGQALNTFSSYIEQNIQWYDNELESQFDKMAEELKKNELYFNASLVYQFIIQCSLKKNTCRIENYYKLMDCYLDAKIENNDKILHCFERILSSIKQFYSTGQVDVRQLKIDYFSFYVMQRLLQTELVDQARSWYEYYYQLHEKIYDPENKAHHPELAFQFATICEHLGLREGYSSKAADLLEKSLTLYLNGLINQSQSTNSKERAPIQKVAGLFYTLKEILPSNQKIQKEYCAILWKAMDDLSLLGVVHIGMKWLPQFILMGTLLCDRDKINYSMILLFKQVCMVLPKYIENSDLKALVEKLTQAEPAALALRSLHMPQESLATAIVRKMDEDQRLIANLQSDNHQLRSQMETKLESKAANSHSAGSDNSNSNSNEVSYHAGQKRPLDATKSAEDNIENTEEESVAKKQKTSHSVTLFVQQPPITAPDVPSEPSTSQRMER